MQVFHLRRGATPAVLPGRQNVSVLAAEYLLTPPEPDALHQPLQPAGPWLGPDSPLYHTRQLRDVKAAGIDALAVVLPPEPRARDALRRNLSRAGRRRRGLRSGLFDDIPIQRAVVAADDRFFHRRA